MDNDWATVYCVGTGGYYPSVCGIDMAFEIEMYNGTVIEALKTPSLRSFSFCQSQVQHGAHLATQYE